MDVGVPGSVCTENVTTHSGGFSSENEYMNQFTDKDFQYSAAQFDTDYLENISSRENADPSSLSRESLYVKFDPLVSQPAARKNRTTGMPTTLSEISENEEEQHQSPEVCKSRSTSSATSNLLMMDTPPRQSHPTSSGNFGRGQGHPLMDSHTTPMNLDLAGPDSHLTAMAQSASKKMYTEDEVAVMVEEVKKEAIEDTKNKYGPEIAALEKELRELEQKPGQVYDECMYVDSILMSEQSLLEKELATCKRLLTEHEQLEGLMVHCHEKLKQKLLTLGEQRDSTLKSEKFRVKSFEELQQRYLKLQEASKKLFKGQTGLDAMQRRTREASGDLHKFSEECLLRQDELNLSYESAQKEISSKLAAERAQTRTIELQVKSLERDLEQKEQEKQQLTQLAEELMKELRNSE